MNSDDGPRHPTRLGIPAHVIADLEPLGHLWIPRFPAESTSFRTTPNDAFTGGGHNAPLARNLAIRKREPPLFEPDSRRTNPTSFIVGSEHHSRLRGQHLEGKGLLQVKFDHRAGMTEIADRDVLADIQFEISAAGREHEPALDGRRPDNSAIDFTFDMMEDRKSVIASATGCGVSIRAEHKGIRSIDTGKTQLAYRPRDGTWIVLGIGGEDDRRIACAFTNSQIPAAT